MESIPFMEFRRPGNADIEALEKYLTTLNDRLRMLWDIQDGLTKSDSRVLLNSILIRLEVEIVDNLSLPGQRIDEIVSLLLDKWKKDIQDKVQKYEDHMHSLMVKFTMTVFKKIYPLFALVEQTRQALRFSRRQMRNKKQRNKFLKRLSLMQHIIESVNLDSLSIYNVDFWQEANENTPKIQIPTLMLPDNVFEGMKIQPEDFNRINLSYQEWNPTEPLIPRCSDWFSKTNLNFSSERWLKARLVGEACTGRDGVFRLWLQEPTPSDPSVSEILWFLSERLRYKIHAGHPSLTRLDAVKRYEPNQMIITYLKKEAHRGIILDDNMREGYCSVFLVDIGAINTFAINEIFIDNDPETELNCIPPLSIECSFLPQEYDVDNVWYMQFNRALKNLQDQDFMFRVLDSYRHPNGRLVRRIFVNEYIHRLVFRQNSSRMQDPRTDMFELSHSSCYDGNAYSLNISSSSVVSDGSVSSVNTKLIRQAPATTDCRFKSPFISENLQMSKFEEVAASEGKSCFVKSCYKLVGQRCSDDSDEERPVKLEDGVSYSETSTKSVGSVFKIPDFDLSTSDVEAGNVLSSIENQREKVSGRKRKSDGEILVYSKCLKGSSEISPTKLMSREIETDL